MVPEHSPVIGHVPSLSQLETAAVAVPPNGAADVHRTHVMSDIACTCCVQAVTDCRLSCKQHKANVHVEVKANDLLPSEDTINRKLPATQMPTVFMTQPQR